MTRTCCRASSTCTTTSPTTRCRCGASRGAPRRGCTTSTGRRPTPTPSRSPSRPGPTPRPARRRCSPTCRCARWPAARPRRRGGRPRTAATARCCATSTPRRPGQSSDDLIYTSVVTKTGDALATSVRRMGEGSGFIYHCAEGQRGSRVHRDFTDLERAEGLLPTLHRHPLLRRRAGRIGRSGRSSLPAGSSGRRCRTSCCTRRRPSSTTSGRGACASASARTGGRRGRRTCSGR